MRRRGHAKRKSVFAAGQRFGDYYRDIVRRLRRQREDGVANHDRPPRQQPQLGRRLRRCPPRDPHAAARAQLAAVHRLKQQIQRHHLGERGRIVRLIGVERLQRPAIADGDDE